MGGREVEPAGEDRQPGPERLVHGLAAGFAVVPVVKRVPPHSEQAGLVVLPSPHAAHLIDGGDRLVVLIERHFDRCAVRSRDRQEVAAPVVEVGRVAPERVGLSDWLGVVVLRGRDRAQRVDRADDQSALVVVPGGVTERIDDDRAARLVVERPPVEVPVTPRAGAARRLVRAVPAEEERQPGAVGLLDEEVPLVRVPEDEPPRVGHRREVSELVVGVGGDVEPLAGLVGVGGCERRDVVPLVVGESDLAAAAVNDLDEPVEVVV